MSVMFQLADHGKFFATRARAREIWELIDALPPEYLIIDWTGVEAVTGSFAGELAKTLDQSPRQVTSVGMNEDVDDTYMRAVVRLQEGSRP